MMNLIISRKREREKGTPLAYAGLGPALPGVGGDFGMGYSQSKATLDLGFNVRARAPHRPFAAPVRGRRAVWYPSGVHGEARSAAAASS